ncbi:hypothetical protein AB6A40_000349 [Gnathostoma spinigerum]|uniref:Uncharacterized protein n=1 Tax=Gnathostoma spinigerum TaxID=75299 RepID=A0ABD6E1Y3_9BILA
MPLFLLIHFEIDCGRYGQLQSTISQIYACRKIGNLLFRREGELQSSNDDDVLLSVCFELLVIFQLVNVTIKNTT